MKNTYLKIIVIFALLLAFNVSVFAQDLDSSNYKIIDPAVDNGGGIGNSANYSILQSAGDPTADHRLTSGNYELKSGFPNGILANVPVLDCFETDTDSGSSDCNYIPGANGTEDICGAFDCYDRAKVELDDQDNPIDTVFLVKIEDLTNTQTYYLQSDHTLGVSYDISDFMTQCELQGRDDDDPDCDDSGDANWDEDLQKMNIYGLLSSNQYRASVTALSGDFSGTRFSNTITATTSAPTISFDIDTATTDTESAAPYEVDLDQLTYVSVSTAAKLIWLDLSSNSLNGVNIFVRDANGQLSSPSSLETIPSETEDLAVDPNSNGGYGLKIASATQSAAGPVQKSSTYDTTGAHEVGALSATNTVIFYTNNTGGNIGPIDAMRASISVKARAVNLDVASPDLNDEITFIAVANF